MLSSDFIELNVKLIRGTSEPVKVLFNTLEQLIFALKLPVAVSNSSERFLSVISAFHRFTEETVSLHGGVAGNFLLGYMKMYNTANHVLVPV